MSAPLLPPGVRVGAALGEDERQVVTLDLRREILAGATRDVVLALPPRQMRALCALLARQCDIVELAERGALPFRVVGGSEA